MKTKKREWFLDERVGVPYVDLVKKHRLIERIRSRRRAAWERWLKCRVDPFIPGPVRDSCWLLLFGWDRAYHSAAHGVSAA